MILGGAQENTLFTVEGLREKDRYDVSLATGPALGPEGSLLARARRSGMSVHELTALRREIHPLRDACAAKQILQLIRTLKPDLIHTHSSKAGILGRLCAHALDVPFIVHTIHGLPFHPYQSALRYHLFVALERWAASVTSRMIAVCQAMRDQALEAGVGTRDQYRIVYSGMEMDPFLNDSPDEEREAFRQRWNLTMDQTVLTKIARLAPLKGHRFLLSVLPDLMDAHPSLHLLLVGDGTERETFEERIDQMGLTDRVTFTGLLPPDHIPRVLDASDLVVHTSLREGLARVLPQSLLSGVPVVSFDVDGAPEVVRSGETGWLVPPEDTDALRTALRDALSDLDRAREMARRGRELCRARFGRRNMVDEIDDVYRRVTRSSSEETNEH